MLAKRVLSLVLAVTSVQAIWPIPESIETGSSTVWIGEVLSVTYNGDRVCWFSASEHPCTFDETMDTNRNFPNWQLPWIRDYIPSGGPKFNSKEIVKGGVSRALKSILDDNFVPWKLYPRLQLQETEPNLRKPKTYVSCLDIIQTDADSAKTFKPLAGDVDESYNLTLSTDGNAKITAVSSTGVLRGLESFSQLFFKHSQGPIYTNLAPVKISDAPQYDHRGILIDVSRNYLPVENIYRTIDAMAWNKLNRLHIHATDSQSWPLEIPALPELHQKGAYAEGLTYSPKTVAAIQTYAIQRGVEVIIEIDSPGHFGIAALSHPDIITGWGASPWSTYCAEPPCGQLQLNNSDVDTFLDTLMDDLMPRVAPYSAYFHTGGDEVNFNEYNLDPTVGTNDSAVVVPLLQQFFDKHHARVRKAGLVPMVWEEIPASYNVTVGDDVVVQSWLGDAAIKSLTAQGHKVISSNYNYWVSKSRYIREMRLSCH